MKLHVSLFLLLSVTTYASPILDSRASKGGKKGPGGKGIGGGSGSPPKSQNNPAPPATSKAAALSPASSKVDPPAASSSQAPQPPSSSAAPASSALTSAVTGSQVISVTPSSSAVASASNTLDVSGSTGSTSPKASDLSGSSSVPATLTASLSTSSVSSTSSSASSTSTGFVCGLNCGSLSCSIRKKPAKRDPTSVQSIEKRTLADVPVGGRDAYVLKTVLDNKDTELDWNFLNTFAVSKQDKFGAKPDTAWVGGIEGCTGIAVVSENGYWVAHLMEEAFVDGNRRQWNEMMNVLRKGDRRYKLPSEQTDLFGPGSNPKIYLMKPRDGKTNLPLYTKKISDIMETIQKGPLSGVSITDLLYKKPVDEAEKNKIDSTTARGKLLVEYDNDQQVDGKTPDPQAAIARVWMEDTFNEQKWDAHDDQKNGVSTPTPTPTPTPSPEPTVPENRPTCLSDEAKALPGDNDPAIQDAIDAICNTANIDLTSAKANTFTGKTADGQDITIQTDIKISADQTGCPESTSKRLPRRFCRSQMLVALKQCPNTSSTGFLGTKPLAWAKATLGCLDFNIFRV